MSIVELRLLGAPELMYKGIPQHFSRRRSLALIAVLALTGRPILRERLLLMFWPDLGPKEAHAALRRDLHDLVKLVGRGCVKIDRSSISLPQDGTFWIDVMDFIEVNHTGEPLFGETGPLTDEIERLQRGSALYRGDFMEGFTLRDSAEFDDWQLFWEDTLRIQFSDLLTRLIRCCMSVGNITKAAEYALKSVELDPLDEDMQQRAIKLLVEAGFPQRAEQQYEDFLRILENEIGETPNPALKSCIEDIRSDRNSRAPNYPPYVLLLKGDFIKNQTTPMEIERSISFYKEALLIDSSYAPAWAALADSYAGMCIPGPCNVRLQKWDALAEEAAMQALSLEPRLSAAHAVLGQLRMERDYCFNEAEQHFLHCLELDPNDFVGLTMWSQGLCYLSRFTEAIALAERAYTISPLNRFAAFNLSVVYGLAGRVADGFSILDEYKRFNPEVIDAYARGYILCSRSGDYDAGIRVLHNAQEAIHPSVSSYIVRLHSLSGEEEEAWKEYQRLLKAAESTLIPAYNLALAQVSLDLYDQALDNLSLSAKNWNTEVLSIGIEPAWDTVRSRKRFHDVVEYIGLNNL